MPSHSQTIVAVAFGLLLALAGGGCSLIEAPAVPPQPVEPSVSPISPAPPMPLVPAKPAPAARPPSLTLPELVGLGEDEVIGLLGRAGSRREVPPATVWEYRSPTCALDLFFYMDMETKRFRALAYDVTATDGTKGDRALNRCLQQIRERRR